MDKKARLLRFACLLTSLEVVVLILSLVAGIMAASPNDNPTLNAPLSLLGRVSDWLMLCHNFLEVCFYGVFARLLAPKDPLYAIGGFLFGLIGLIALSGSIVIELEFLPRLNQQPPLGDLFDFGYGSIDGLLSLIGSFAMLPVNGCFAFAALRHPQSRPIVPVVLFMGVLIGLVNLLIPDQASGWLQFLGDWMVPTFVLCKLLVLLWWFGVLLNEPVPRTSALGETILGSSGGADVIPLPSNGLGLQPDSQRAATPRSRF